MKRLLPVLLAALLTASLSACNNSASPSVSPSSSQSPSTDVPSPSPQVSVGIDAESTWGDPSFEKLIRAALNVPEGEVDAETTASVKKLSIMPQGDKVRVVIDNNAPADVEIDTSIKTLEDLARFTGLNEFELGYAELETIDHLVIFPMLGGNLESLTIINAGVEDITTLSSIATLKTINLSGNQITDISPLMTLPALEKLDISGNPLADASQVQQFEGVDVTY